MKRRGGATTSLILGIAGVIGVGVAGGMALTGTTPCEIMSACGIKPEAKIETVAMSGDATTCPITGAKATTVATTSDSGCCASKTEATPVAQTVATTSDSGCCASKTEAAPLAQTVALADCSNDPECAVDDGIACSTKGADCHKVNANATCAPAVDGVEVKVVTASHTEAASTKAEGELCAMAATCSPANCTEGMMKACTDSGKVCPEDKSATPAAPAAQTVATTATEAKSCCSSGGKATVIAAAAKPAVEVMIAPDAIRPLFTLEFSGKGMPMLIPAAMLNASACETKEAGACGGGGCGEKKAAEATATTASIR